jgi:glutamine cyclotransferase
MKKILALVLAIVLVIAFVVPYIGKTEPNAQEQIDFGFKSSSTFLAVQQGKPFVFAMNTGQNVDRIELSLNGSLVKSWDAEEKRGWPEGEALTFQIPTQGYALGTYSIELSGFSSAELVNNDERFLFVNAQNVLQEQQFELLNTHPHNPNNFTQGYEFLNDKLYESTGNPRQTNATMVAEINLKTGASINQVNRSNPIFGEGITIIGSKLYQVSWQDEQCFVYDLEGLNILDTLSYQGEGWGLCNDGTSIIMSNGTNRITFRDPKDFEVTKTIEVHSDRGPVTNLNELEYVNGRIYANVWMSEQRFQHDARMNLTKIVVINPETGAVESFIDIQDILRKASATNVPNGIAFRSSTNSFWLTGKYWNQVYEIQLNAKNI